MPSLSMAGWVLQHLVRHPLAWIWVGSIAVLRAWAEVLSPVGMTTATSGMAPLNYEVAFMSELVGGALALLPLSRGEWFLARLGGGTRMQARGAGLAAGAGVGLALGLLPQALFETRWPSGALTLALDGAAALLHVTLLGLLLLNLPLPGATRALALLALSWVLPALLTGSDFLPSALNGLFDVAAQLESARDPANDQPLARWAPLVALCGAVLLLESRTGRGATRPAADALQA